MNADWRKVLVAKNITIKDALVLLNQTSLRILLVIDSSGKLLGTITDGDIRRGLLKGLTLSDEVETIIFTEPLVALLNDLNKDVVKKALKARIHQIPIVDDFNNVVGLKEVDELIKPSIKSNKIILMVGGLGTRLYPLTKETPKPMLEVGNKPILHTIIDSFSRCGFVDIIMCVNYKADAIKKYFGDGERFGVKIEYVFEKERMGTAGALSLLNSRPKESFFVMNGDLLTNINFENLYEYHISQNSVATMCVREYEFQVPYGVVDIVDNKVVSISEKPMHKFFVSAGIYMLSPDVLDLIPNKKYYDMPTLFEKIMEKNNAIFSFPIHEYWLDIGRMNEYEQANREYSGVFFD